MLHNQVRWCDLPALRLSKSTPRNAESAGTASSRSEQSPSSTGRQQCLSDAWVWLQEPELCSAQLRPQTIARPGWGCAWHPHPSVGGRIRSISRDEISGGECKLLQLNAHQPSGGAKMKIFTLIFFFFNRFTIAKGKAMKTLDFLIVWDSNNLIIIFLWTKYSQIFLMNHYSMHCNFTRLHLITSTETNTQIFQLGAATCTDSLSTKPSATFLWWTFFFQEMTQRHR